MKNIVLCLMLICLVPAHTVFADKTFPDWSLGLSGWFADGSNFDEQPGPDTTGHIWGDFPTNHYTLGISKSFLRQVNVSVALTKSYMLANWMYLHSDQVYTGFNGEGIELNTALSYRLNLFSPSAVDFGLGFQYVNAIKRFIDLTDNGTVINEGQWGDCKISYYGPVFRATIHYWFMPQLDIYATILGAPFMHNKTEVTGYPQPINEEASGLRYRWEAGLHFSPIGHFVLSGGYRFEDIYFPEPANDSFSLHITYKGLFIETGYEF